MKITVIEANGIVTLVYSETLLPLKQMELTLDDLNLIRYEILKVNYISYFEEDDLLTRENQVKSFLVDWEFKSIGQSNLKL